MKPRTLIALSLTLFAALALFAFSVILPARGNTFDFYPRYVGAQAVWRGISPYSEEVTTQIQIGMFGDVLPDEADQQRFAYPAYTAVLIAPFIVFSADISTALWMALQVVALAWALWLWIEILNWNLPPIQRCALIAAVVVAFRYPITLYLIAQFTGVIILCITLGVYFLQKQCDVFAGIFFAFATIQPTISAPLAGALLIGYALRGRWKGLVAFVVALGILTAITVIQIGWWMPDFLVNLRDYARYATYYLWTPDLFESPVLKIAFVALLLFVLVWTLWRFLRRSHPVEARERTIPFLFTLVCTFLLLLPQTGTYYLVLLFPLLLTSLQNAAQLKGMTKGLALLGFASGLLIPWFYLIQPEETRKIEALLLPLHIWLVWVGTAWLVRESKKNSTSVEVNSRAPLQSDVQM
ncbi:MAG TPA: glycosyltransferase family 87 protein [Oceanobacillus sp.]|nr:glycosyltransferase family 87 protein [Oceanobacillus sp.]